MLQVALEHKSHKSIELIDDLLGMLFLLLTIAFGVLVELTRRKACTLAQFSFTLASTCGILILGGLVDHHITDETLEQALFGSYVQYSVVFQLKYLPLSIAGASTLAFFIKATLCTSTCCCFAIPDPNTKEIQHQQCFVYRLRQSFSLYLLSIVALYISVGMRLNARLRLSSIKPVGGTLHWQAIQCPLILSTLHTASLLLILLRNLIQHVGENIIN